MLKVTYKPVLFFEEFLIKIATPNIPLNYVPVNEELNNFRIAYESFLVRPCGVFPRRNASYRPWT